MDEQGRSFVRMRLRLQCVRDVLSTIEHAISIKGVRYAAASHWIRFKSNQCLMTSYRSKYLGDPAFAPLMADLNRRKAVVYVHPVRADCCRGLVANVNDPTIELPQDTARTILSVVFSGNAGRYSDIRFIFSHAGGTLPLLIHRVEGWANNREDLAAERFPEGVRAEFRRFYYDTASSDHPWTMMPLTKLVDTTQVVFGTDFPFRSAAATAKGLAEYGFNPADLAAIGRGNALKLMPSLA